MIPAHWLTAVPRPPFGADRAEAAVDALGPEVRAAREYILAALRAARDEREVRDAREGRPRPERRWIGCDAAIRIRACMHVLDGIAASIRAGRPLVPPYGGRELEEISFDLAYWLAPRWWEGER